MAFAATWMAPEIVTLGEAKTEKEKYHNIPFMWNLERKVL